MVKAQNDRVTLTNAATGVSISTRSAVERVNLQARGYRVTDAPAGGDATETGGEGKGKSKGKGNAPAGAPKN